MIRSFLLTLSFAAVVVAQTPCDKLKSLKLDSATITIAENVPAGDFRAQGAAAEGKQAAAPLRVPAFCRVAATLAPSSDSSIDIEVWLPADWNGKYQAVGGGGWAGIISYPAMALAVSEGYATSSTDTGHKGGNAQFALGHPEKIVDFGHRAMHEMTLKSKALINAHYGKTPRLSYFNGCSTGGRQALVEAFRYPEDYDGIIAGAPAHPHVYLHSAGVAMSIDLMNIPDHTLNPAKQELLAASVMKACDALDGVKDGLVGNPQLCKFDPAVLLCKGSDSDSCLTAPQLAAVKRVYTDTRTKKGELIWTGHAFGGEASWGMLRTQATAPSGGFDTIRILGYQDPNFDWRKFDLDRDVALTEDRSQIDVISSDLSKFKNHGGKLLLYHGWADAGISPGHTIAFYQSVLETMGKNQDDWLKLYMVPGMGHCRGGAGPDQFNYVAAMERWREAKEAPAQIIASHVTNGRVDRTRPLCPYPQVATYKGSGSTNDAASFSCKVP